jgi:hypothetical protein
MRSAPQSSIIFKYSPISSSGMSKSQLNGPALSKIPLEIRDLYGNGVEKVRSRVPFGLKKLTKQSVNHNVSCCHTSRLKISCLKRFDCFEIYCCAPSGEYSSRWKRVSSGVDQSSVIFFSGSIWYQVQHASISYSTLCALVL